MNKPTFPDPSSRRALILEILRAGKTMTTADAINLRLGWRLAADVHALRSRGWNIVTTPLQREGRAPIAKYSLKAGG